VEPLARVEAGARGRLRPAGGLGLGGEQGRLAEQGAIALALGQRRLEAGEVGGDGSLDQRRCA
jgi:hypothetical protein